MDKFSYWDIFKQAATRSPNNVAMIYCEHGMYQKFYYGKLYAISDRLYSSMNGIISKGENVGVLMKHNILLPSIIAMIHRLQCKFVFLNPDLEESSNKQFINEIKLSKIFATSDDLIYDGFRKMDLSKTINEANLQLYLWISETLPDWPNCQLEDIAYYVKTSGSTSIAKNVAVTHQCIYLNIKAIDDVFEIQASDVIYFSTALTFDPSIVEIYLGAISGASLLICSDMVNNMTLLFPQDSSENSGITIWQTTPSLFLRSGSENIKNIIFSAKSRLRILALGGEPIREYKKLNVLKHKENKTAIYNLYGITEISCWASIGKLDFSALESCADTSIGTPLSHTFIKVCDENNEIIKTGIGNILIGSKSRKCLVGAEIQDCCEKVQQINGKTLLNDGCTLWRTTGDLGEIMPNGQTYFRGRHDRVVKRYGHKVNLLEIETIASNLHDVHQCACVWLPKYNSLLLLYSSINDITDKLWNHLKNTLENNLMPDYIYKIDQIPLSSHGKVSTARAYDLYENLLKSNQMNLKNIFFDSLCEMLPLRKRGIENLEGKSIVQLGGNSIISLQIINRLQNITKVDYSDIFYHLMSDCPLKDVFQYIQTNFNKSSNLHNLKVKENMLNPVSQINVEMEIPANIFKSGSRQAEISSDKRKKDSPVDKEYCKKKCDTLYNDYSIEIAMLWKFNLGKCIDANPIIYASERISPLVTVGSHSGKVVFMDALSGDLIHLLDVSSRVEAPILCFEDDFANSYAVVGCYDGSLWCLSLHNYKIAWKVLLNNMIKSKASYYKSKIFSATYESVIWSVCGKTGKILSNISVGARGISADLAISEEKLFAAALDGTVVCVDVSTTKLTVRWKKQLSSPVFATPTLLKNGSQVLFSEVKGVIHCLEALSGNTVWTFADAKGLIFSSCLVYTLDIEEFIVFGCHDRHSYHLRSRDGSHCVLDTRIKHTSEIYASPAIREDNIICVATNGDVQTINTRTKQVAHAYKLNGEVFSSPEVFRDMIFVGCRDDNLYCLKIIL